MIDDPLNRLKVKRGSDLPHSKLDENKVKEIRAIVVHRQEMDAVRSQLTNKKIAALYGVHYRTIDRITAGEAWGHVD